MPVLRSRMPAHYGLHRDFTPEATGAPASTNDKGTVPVNDPPLHRKLLANFLPSMEHFRHLSVLASKMKSIPKGCRIGSRNLYISFFELTELQTRDYSLRPLAWVVSLYMSFFCLFVGHGEVAYVWVEFPFVIQLHNRRLF
jgi:hypothetical protein